MLRLALAMYSDFSEPALSVSHKQTRREPVPRWWLMFLGFTAFAALVRWQTFGNPVIGFDEQFYLLVGDQMWNHHALPYVDIFDRKPIGLFLIYAGIRALGGDGFLAYKLVALMFVAATASLVARMAARHARRTGALMAGALYILWLNFTECEGGQADVFFALPMALAAMLVWAAWLSRKQVMARGCAAMALVGIALQIKYSVVIEGVFFGVVLLAARWRAGGGLAAVVRLAVPLVACALAPTALAAAWYWHVGQLHAFIFANFLSNMGRNPLPMTEQLINYAEMAGIFAPLAIMIALARRRLSHIIDFPTVWTGVALLSVVVIGHAGSSHYIAGALLPATIAAAPAFGEGKRARRWAAGVLVLLFAVSQLVLWRVAYLKGGAREATTLAVAASPRHGCIYVYDGYTALYMLTHSCLPTRWAFPGHLNTQDEASLKAIGVDPVAEVRRILAAHPEVIIDDWPAYDRGNRQTRALVQAALARDYHLTLRLGTGPNRYRLVYRRGVDAQNGPAGFGRNP